MGRGAGRAEPVKAESRNEYPGYQSPNRSPRDRYDGWQYCSCFRDVALDWILTGGSHTPEAEQFHIKGVGLEPHVRHHLV